MNTKRSITLALLISLILLFPMGNMHIFGLTFRAASVSAAGLDWSQVSSLPEPLTEVSAVSNGSHMYVVGGMDGGPYTSDVSYAQVNPNGSLGGWSATTSLPVAQVMHNAVVISDGYLFVIGGYACCWGGLASVYSAPILPDGSLGSWSALTSLPGDLYRSAAVVNDGYLYVMGGWSDNYGTAQSTVYRAAINSNGTIGAWTDLTPLPNPLHAHTAFANDGYIYVIGGMTGLLSGTLRPDVYQAFINPDGTLGSWVALEPLPAALQSHASAIWQGNIVVTGGRADAMSDEVASTYLAALQPDGSIGAWSVEADLPLPLAFHASVSVNNHIYVIGGSDGTSRQSAIYMEEIPLAATATPSPTPTPTGQWRLVGFQGSGIFSIAFSTDYVNDQTILIGGFDGVFRSTDGGDNWSLIDTGAVDLAELRFSPDYVNDQTVFAAAFGDGNTGVYKSVDGGLTWTIVGSPAIEAFPLAISPNYASDQTLFAGDNSGSGGHIIRSTDGGVSWEDMGLLAAGFDIRDLVVSPDFASDGTVFAGIGQYWNWFQGGVYRSTDGGDTWTDTTPSQTYREIGSLAISPNYQNDHIVFFTAWEGGVFRSTNGGNSWSEVNIGQPNRRPSALGFSPNYATDRKIFLGTWGEYSDGGAYVSANSGDSWTVLNDGLTTRWLHRIVVSPNYANDHLVLAGGEETNGGGLWAYEAEIQPPPATPTPVPTATFTPSPTPTPVVLTVPPCLLDFTPDPKTCLVSVRSDNEQGNGSSTGDPVISADGKYSAFSSRASNLVIGGNDTNGLEDVFLKNLETGEVNLVSVADDGGPSNGASRGPAIAVVDEGGLETIYVAFVSNASDLLTPGEDSNSLADIFVRNLRTGETQRVSVTSSGAQANAASGDDVAISADARFVAFSSLEVLTPSDLNGVRDIYAHDLDTGQVTLVSVDSNEVPGDARSGDGSVDRDPAISADGRYIAFQSSAAFVPDDTAGIQDIYRRDLINGTTVRVSVSYSVSDPDYPNPNNASWAPSISADGRFVAFFSPATDILPDPISDTPRYQDVYVRDMDEGATEVVSVGQDGDPGNSFSRYPSISADGCLIAFTSLAGTFVPEGETNDQGDDIFVHDRCLTHQTIRVSNASDGTKGNLGSSDPSLWANEDRLLRVVFISFANNLLGSGVDANAQPDVFVHEIGFPEPTSGRISGTVLDAATGQPLDTVLVHLLGSGMGDCTDVNGNYSISGLDFGSYQVEAEAGGPWCGESTTLDYASEWWPEALSLQDAGLVILSAEAPDATDIDFTLGPGGTVAGVVRDSGGNPLQNIYVSADDMQAGIGHGACSNADGEYKVTGLATDHSYHISAGYDYCGTPGFYVEFWQESLTQSGATPVGLTESLRHVDGIDFSLSEIPSETNTGTPYIIDSVFANAVWGEEWPAGIPVTLTIDDPNNGPSIDYSDTRTGDPYDFDPSLSGVGFELNGYFVLSPGMFVTLTNGTITKMHIVSGVTIQNVDADTDQVFGSSEPDSEVFVACGDDRIPRRITADSSGNWMADFSVPGPDESESELCDITPFVGFFAIVGDPQNDLTKTDWNGLFPHIEVLAFADRLAVVDWPAGVPVEISIDDPSTGPSPDYEGSFTPAESPGYYEFFPAYDIKVGDIVTASNGEISKTLEVALLQATDVDRFAGTVDGIAQPDIQFDMQVTGDHILIPIYDVVQTDGNGNWSVDFSDVTDLPWTWTTIGTMWQWDDDGDSTVANWHMHWPVLEVWLKEAELRAFDWELGTTLTFTVDDPSTPQPVDFTEQAPVTPLTWMDHGGATVSVNGFDLQPGMVVTVTDGTTTKSTIIQSIRFTELDAVNDTVRGTAPDNAALDLILEKDFQQRFFSADEDGNWLVDYQAPDPVGRTADLLPGDRFVGLFIRDEDVDSTVVSGHVPYPTFSVQMVEDEVNGYEWPLGALVNLDIDDPDTAQPVDYTDSQTVVVADWDLDQTFVQFRLWEDAFTVEPGMVLTMSDGSTTKVHITTGLTVTAVDLGQDTVSGTANPDSLVEVGPICDEDGCAFRREYADANGDWLADFSTPGDEGDEQDPFDIRPGTVGEARQPDEDFDATTVRWDVPAFSTFVVLGREGVWLKENSDVLSGDVAANVAAQGPYLADQSEVTIGQNTQFMDPASRVLGDSVSLKQGSQVYDVYYNHLDGSGSVLGTHHTPLDLPVLAQLPAVPTVTPGTQNFTVPINGTLTLDAGSYGKLVTKKGATVTFTGGIYHFTEWSLGDDVKVYFAAPTEIRIAGKLDTGADAFVGPATGSGLTARDIFIYVLGVNGNTGNLGATPKAAKFGMRATLIANVYAPNGTLWIREHSSVTGAFYGRWVEIGQNVNLSLNNGWQ